MATTYVMRPSRPDDLDALMHLAELSGPGFTSLPVDAPILAERLAKSDRAFHGRQRNLQYGKYLMMMEHIATGQVVGCSAVKAGTGIDQPFFNPPFAILENFVITLQPGCPWNCLPYSQWCRTEFYFWSC
jgi:arginine N-succinyltransferase